MKTLKDGFKVREIEERGRFPNVGSAKRLPIGPDDRVLDVGAHIGAFSWLCYRAGCRALLAVEPEPGNASMWRQNCGQLNAAFTLEEAAAVGDAYTEDYAELWLSAVETSYTHSMVKRRGRVECIRVRALRYGALVKALSPTVVKVDVEGAEYDFAIPDRLDGVRALSVDFHRRPDLDHIAEAMRIMRAIADLGFRALSLPTFGGMNTWGGAWAR